MADRPICGEADAFVYAAELFTFALMEVCIQTFLLKVMQLLDRLVTQEQL